MNNYYLVNCRLCSLGGFQFSNCIYHELKEVFLMKSSISACSELKDLILLYVSPAVENNHSDAIDVGGGARYHLATWIFVTVVENDVCSPSTI